VADGTGLTDEVITELNPLPEPERERKVRELYQEPPLPSRPADSAAKGDWVNYCVALGADASIAEDTEHWEGDKDTGQRVTVKALTKAELIELADRLGG
jgi:hypothetical protein